MEVEHGANLNHTGAVQIGDRLKAADSSLENQGHQEGLHRIVVMVPQRDLVASPVKQCLVQCAPAHFRAHGAGIFFLAVVKDYGGNFRIYNGIGHIQLPAQLTDAAVIHVKPHIYGNGLQRKGLIVVAPQPSQKDKQRKRILAAGHAHGDFIPCINHMIVLHAPADQAH